MEKFENKTKWNGITEYEIEKVKQTNKKNPYIIQLFLNMAAHQKHIWSSGEKKSNTGAFEFFKKLQGNSDMHLDFKKWLQVFLLNVSFGDTEFYTFFVNQSW